MAKKLALSLSILLCSVYTQAQVNEARENDQKIFDISKNIEIFTEALYNLQSYSLYDVEPNTLTKEGLNVMMNSLDRYTNYYAESDVQDYLYLRTGKYEGLGLSFFKGRDSSIIISDIIAGGEAENSGLQIGDTILTVNGKKLMPMTVEQVRDYFQQIDAQDIQLSIKKVYSGKSQEISLNKGTVQKNKLGYAGWLSNFKDSSVSIIKLNKFTPDCAAMVGSALDSLYLVNPKMEGIVLDLRSNPGGLLMEAVKLVNLFIDKDKLVVYTQGRISDDKHTYNTKAAPKFEDMTLYVLIDTHSASASEIVSGALQDYDRAVIIGVNSFGKGLVQNFKKLPFNTQMKLTTAKYYIPSGRCIQALDYSRKNPDGSAYLTPENQRKKFKTANGRQVLDGRGVTPDVIVKEEKSEVLEQLDNQHLIFEFVSSDIDISSLNSKAQVKSNLDNYLSRFYKWLESNDAWKTLPFYKHWGELVKSNEESKMLPTQDMQSFEQAMYTSLIDNIREVENGLKIKIKEEILRRMLSDYDYYEQNMALDQYFTQVEVIQDNGEYQKILKP